MNDIFASLFEWFGLIPFFSKDLGDHLRGFDVTCSDYIGTPLYLYVGLLMIAIVIVGYVLQYYVVNSSTFNKRIHWWIVALLICVFNFIVGFGFPFNDLESSNYCSQLHISTPDCAGFGFSVAIWGFLLFVLITSPPYPRGLAGHNVTETTFWKPK